MAKIMKCVSVVVRLVVGELINYFMRNRADYTKIWVGAFEVFLVTSILSAGFDLLFVFMQRFNRSRILKIREMK